MIRVLIVSKIIPYPLTHGGNVAQYSMLSYLQNYIKIDYCLLVSNDSQFKLVDDLKIKLPKINFIIISVIKNDKKKTLTEKVYVFYKNIVKKILFNKEKIYNDYDEFRNSKFNLLSVKTEDYIDKLIEVIKSGEWDIIQTEFYEMIDIIVNFHKNVKTVFVSHESRTLRMLTAMNISKASDSFKQYLTNINKIIETGFLNLYDRIIVFSEEDKKRLNGFGVKNIRVSPFSVVSNETEDIKHEKFQNLVFLGGSNHYPNEEGLNWFINHIYPDIYNKYRLNLYIVGIWKESKKIQSNIGKIIYKGYVEDLKSVIENSILIVPIRIGNGIRTKILTGLSLRTPIISTSIGYEGLNLTDNKDIFVADTKEEFTNKIDYILHSDLTKIEVVLNDGFSFYEKFYSVEAVGKKRLEIYNELIHE